MLVTAPFLWEVFSCGTNPFDNQNAPNQWWDWRILGPRRHWRLCLPIVDTNIILLWRRVDISIKSLPKTSWRIQVNNVDKSAFKKNYCTRTLKLRVSPGQSMAGNDICFLGWLISCLFLGFMYGYVRFREFKRATKHLASDNSKTCWSISWSKSCWKEASDRQGMHECRFRVRLFGVWERKKKTQTLHTPSSHPPKKNSQLAFLWPVY